MDSVIRAAVSLACRVEGKKQAIRHLSCMAPFPEDWRTDVVPVRHTSLTVLKPMNTLTVELPHDIDPEEARLLLSIKLFEDGHISLGKAAEMAGYTKRTYMELLGKRGIPVFNYTPEDLADERTRWTNR